MKKETRRWIIWELCEEDIDHEAEEMGIKLTAKEMEEVARRYKREFHLASEGWEEGLRNFIESVKESKRRR